MLASRIPASGCALRPWPGTPGSVPVELMSARTGVHCCYQHEAGGERERHVGAGDGHRAVFQWLTVVVLASGRCIEVGRGLDAGTLERLLGLLEPV